MTYELQELRKCRDRAHLALVWRVYTALLPLMGESRRIYEDAFRLRAGELGLRWRK